MKNKWGSFQAIFVIAVIVIIFSYIFIDILHTNPQFKSEMKNIKKQYVELSCFLDKKVPVIDSTFKEHTLQINEIKESQSDIQKTQNAISKAMRFKRSN